MEYPPEELLRQRILARAADLGHNVLAAARCAETPKAVGQVEPVDSSAAYNDWDIRPWFGDETLKPEEYNIPGNALGLVTNHLGTLVDGQKTVLGREQWIEMTDHQPEGNIRQIQLCGRELNEMELCRSDRIWYFSAGVANFLTWRMKSKGLITPSQWDALTPNDYAAMIGSPWFADLIHEFAPIMDEGSEFGGETLSFGREPANYSGQWPEDVPDYLRSPEYPLTYEQYVDPETGRTLPRVRVSGTLHTYLQERAIAAGPGYLVGRHNGSLAPELVNDKSVQRLVQTGRVALTGSLDERGRQRFIQQKTPIDIGLHGLAHHLRTYDERYGMPIGAVLNDHGHMTTMHQRRVATGLLAT